MYNGFKVQSKIKGEYSIDYISDFERLILELASNSNSFFIIDSTVYSLHSGVFCQIESTSRLIVVESSEKNKTVEFSLELIKRLINQNIRRDDVLIAIGGGIIQDLVAFISSILFRGINWIFFPTTLLAQCDSCIGSKSSINFDGYKNLLGTFNPPLRIYIYSGFLESLSEAEIRSGVGEMFHYFFTDGYLVAQELSNRINEVIHNRSELRFFIDKSLQIKKKIIEIDEFDHSIRHIFNFGHTFGHALETITNYNITHGQAITYGMDLANYISLRMNHITDIEFNQLHEILIKNLPRFSLNESNLSDYINALMKDKKNIGNTIGCILSIGMGKVQKFQIDNNDQLKSIILDYSHKYHI